MGMRVTCSNCRNKVEKVIAIQIPGEKYNKYFCCQECYDTYTNKKEISVKEKAEYDEIFEETKTIFGYEFQGYGMLKREVKNWEKLADRKKILSYLKENEDFLSSTLARKEFANDFNRVRYYSVIVSSKLHDYREKRVQLPVVDDAMPKESSFVLFEPVRENKKVRKSFAELEDDL